MSTVYSLLLDFSEKEEEESCSGLLLQIPEQEVAVGDAVEVRLWGAELLLNESWTLYQGGMSLGVGEIVYDWSYVPDGQGGLVPESTDAGVFEQVVTFEDSCEAQLDLPFQELVFMKALTQLCYIGADGKPKVHAPRGASCFERCGQWWSRRGYSYVKLNAELPIYGAVLVRARNIRTYRCWTWTVPDNAAGLAWFFLYRNDLLYKSFTIELPELECAATETRNITLKVIDHATETAVAGALVAIDGVAAGSTDENGELRVDAVTTGDHNIAVSAQGYLDTDQDELSNETISVV